MYTLTGVDASEELSVFRVFGYVMLKPAALENVVLFPTVVCVAGIGVGVGVVLVVQPAVVAATINSAITASAAIRLRLHCFSSFLLMF